MLERSGSSRAVFWWCQIRKIKFFYFLDISQIQHPQMCGIWVYMDGLGCFGDSLGMVWGWFGMASSKTLMFWRPPGIGQVKTNILSVRIAKQSEQRAVRIAKQSAGCLAIRTSVSLMMLSYRGSVSAEMLT